MNTRTVPRMQVTKPTRPPIGPCTHWLGNNRRACGSQLGVRLYIQGPRCPIHTPNALKGDTTA